MLQADGCDQPALCNQGGVMVPCPCQMHSLPCLDPAAVCLPCPHQGLNHVSTGKDVLCKGKGTSPVPGLCSLPCSPAPQGNWFSFTSPVWSC